MVPSPREARSGPASDPTQQAGSFSVHVPLSLCSPVRKRKVMPWAQSRRSGVSTYSARSSWSGRGVTPPDASAKSGNAKAGLTRNLTSRSTPSLSHAMGAPFRLWGSISPLHPFLVLAVPMDPDRADGPSLAMVPCPTSVQPDSRARRLVRITSLQCFGRNCGTRCCRHASEHPGRVLHGVLVADVGLLRSR